MAADLTVKDSTGVVHTIRFDTGPALPQGATADTLRADFFTKETKGAPTKIVIKMQLYPDKPIDLEKLRDTTAIERQLRDSYLSCDPLSHIICFLGVAGDAAVKAIFDGPDFYSIDGADGKIYLLYRYIKGVDLKHFTGDFTADTIRQIVVAVKQIHAAGIIHRDIKPDNIMIGEDGIVRLIDFGTSCRQADVLKHPSGTPFYLSPEAWLLMPEIPSDIIGKSEKEIDSVKGNLIVDATCVDVFAVGATLFYLLTKKQFIKSLCEKINGRSPKTLIALVTFMIKGYSIHYAEYFDFLKTISTDSNTTDVFNLIKAMVNPDHTARLKLEEYLPDRAAAAAAQNKGKETGDGSAVGGAGAGAVGAATPNKGKAIGGGTRRVLKKKRNRRRCRQSKRNHLH